MRKQKWLNYTVEHRYRVGVYPLLLRVMRLPKLTRDTGPLLFIGVGYITSPPYFQFLPVSLQSLPTVNLMELP